MSTTYMFGVGGTLNTENILKTENEKSTKMENKENKG